MKCTIINFYEDKLTKEDMNTKFLGLEIDKNIDWKIHIMHTLLKLGSACYTVRCMLHRGNAETLIVHIFVR